MMVAGVREIVKLVLAGVEGAGGDFVQQRFPQMRGRYSDQGNLRRAALAELVAQHSGEFQPAGAATYDNDTVRVGCHGFICSLQSSRIIRGMLRYTTFIILRLEPQCINPKA